eukprot:GGOE01057926.1.p1 GENE.GGOE01057926.1~~GGOE01057926.1.p1  ORF type:complete len:728 (-),score=179.65 GGOE01057926.1:571-2754(-)
MTRKRASKELVRLRGTGGKPEEEGSHGSESLLDLLDGLAAPGAQGSLPPEVREAVRELEDDENEARFMLHLEETTQFGALNIAKGAGRKGPASHAASAPAGPTSARVTAQPTPTSEVRRRRSQPQRHDATPTPPPPPPTTAAAPAAIALALPVPAPATAAAATTPKAPEPVSQPLPPAEGEDTSPSASLRSTREGPTARSPKPARPSSVTRRHPPTSPADSPRPQAPSSLKAEAAPGLQKASASVRRAEGCPPICLEQGMTAHPEPTITQPLPRNVLLYHPPADTLAEQQAMAEALAEPSLSELLASLEAERGRHWRRQAKKWHLALELDCERGFGVEVTYRLQRGQVDQQHALQFLRLLLSGGHPGWSVQPASQRSDLQLTSPVLVGTTGLQGLCTVLWEMEAACRVLPLTGHDLVVYVAAYDGLVERLKGLCLNYYLFEPGLGVLLCASDQRVVSLQRNSKLARLAPEEALEQLAQATTMPDLLRLVNPEGLRRGSCHAVDLSHLQQGEPPATRWHRCVRFNAHLGSFSWRQVQPWVMVLTLFVDNSFAEVEMHHRRRPTITNKYVQRVKRSEVVTPVEVCGDMFTLVVHHQDLYLICREQCRTGPRHQLRPFIGLLNCKDDESASKRTSHYAHLSLTKSCRPVGVPLDITSTASQSSSGHPLAFLKVPTNTKGKLLRHRRALQAGTSAGFGGSGWNDPPWADMPQYRYDFDLLALSHSQGPLVA